MVDTIKEYFTLPGRIVFIPPAWFFFVYTIFAKLVKTTKFVVPGQSFLDFLSC